MVSPETGEPNPRSAITCRRAEPQRAWICGYAELGKCCKAGPTPDGRCGRIPAKADNRRSATRSGDDWQPVDGIDDQPDRSQDDDLPTCIPRRSHWHHRNSLRINLAVLTGGILLLVMSLPSREKHFVPGELSRKHAQILENTLVSQRCGLCHPNSHAGSEIPSSALGALALDAGRQDALCLQCHKGHMPAAGARMPHDLSREMWDMRAGSQHAPSLGHPSNSRAGREVTTVSADSADRAIAETSCATCHIEHHGRGFDLKAMADDRCQACHRRKFESFASGHPDFTNFPVERGRALAFSHRLHADKHFPQKSREFDCRQCHVDATATTASGPVSRSVSFNTACAECHREPIRAAISGGWAMLELPSIEADAGDSESGLENWPRAARFGFEGTISPVLRALLAADPSAQQALEKLPPSGRLSDLSTFDNARQETTTALARAIEKLILDTAREGQLAWHARLEKVTRAKLGRELSASDQRLIEAMIAGLPPDLFRKIQLEWFRSNETLADNRPQVKLTATRTSTADDGGDDDDLLLGETEADEGLLSPNARGRSSEPSLVDDSLLNDALIAPAKDDLAQGSTASGEHSQSASFKGATHVSAGGWYIDEPTLALKYMPTGHADSTLAAWSLWWHRTEPQAQSLLSRSIAAQIPGSCIECHQLPARVSNDPPQAWTLASEWKVLQRPASQKEFTKFNHAPHLSLPAVNDCKYCHVLPAASGLERLNAAAPHSQPHVLGSEFEKMHLSQCVACHRPNAANAGCLQCHNYHITAVPETAYGR